MHNIKENRCEVLNAMFCDRAGTLVIVIRVMQICHCMHFIHCLYSTDIYNLDAFPCMHVCSDVTHALACMMLRHGMYPSSKVVLHICKNRHFRALKPSQIVKSFLFPQNLGEKCATCQY